MSFYAVIQRSNQTALYWFSTYWFSISYPFRPLIHSALIGSDVAIERWCNFENLDFGESGLFLLFFVRTFMLLSNLTVN
ncbi:hypothetical protein Hanom_Chr02g00110761 [Helianthus anomalus]